MPRRRRQRPQWCGARLSCSDSEWQWLVFSDEPRFCLGGDGRRICVWRHRDQRHDERFVVTRHTSRRPGVVVWGTISYDARSPLVFITGTLTAQRYVNEVLQPAALSFLNAHFRTMLVRILLPSQELILKTDTMPGQQHRQTYPQLKMCGMLLDAL